MLSLNVTTECYLLRDLYLVATFAVADSKLERDESTVTLLGHHPSMAFLPRRTTFRHFTMVSRRSPVYPLGRANQGVSQETAGVLAPHTTLTLSLTLPISIPLSISHYN